jgi:hypothetical protein
MVAISPAARPGASFQKLSKKDIRAELQLAHIGARARDLAEVGHIQVYRFIICE